MGRSHPEASTRSRPLRRKQPLLGQKQTSKARGLALRRPEGAPETWVKP